MSKLAPHVQDSLRTKFEDKVFTRYYISTIQRTGLGGPCELQPKGCKTKAEFLARADDGSYLEPTLNAAWWAWQAATEVARDYTTAAGEAAQEYCESFGEFAVRTPATFRWQELFDHMQQANDPKPFKVGDRVYFGRGHYEFIGHVVAFEGKTVICEGVETGCLQWEKEQARISYLQSLRVVTDDTEWARLTANEPAFKTQAVG